MNEPFLNDSKKLRFLAIFKYVSLNILQNVVRSLLSTGGPFAMTNFSFSLQLSEIYFIGFSKNLSFIVIFGIICQERALHGM